MANKVEEKVIIQVGEGDLQAFHQLYVSVSKDVYVFALSILQNQDEAKDVMQDTFLKIRKHAHQYKAQGKPMAWILTIVRNECYMKLRERKKNQEFFKQEQGEKDEIHQLEDRLMLIEVLDKLKEEEREILILHFVVGLKYKEIAEILDTPLGTILSKYKRSLEKLKTYLEKGDN